jgi:hypothetical protein
MQYDIYSKIPKVFNSTQFFKAANAEKLSVPAVYKLLKEYILRGKIIRIKNNLYAKKGTDAFVIANYVFGHQGIKIS